MQLARDYCFCQAGGRICVGSRERVQVWKDESSGSTEIIEKESRKRKQMIGRNCVVDKLFIYSFATRNWPASGWLSYVCCNDNSSQLRLRGGS